MNQPASVSSLSGAQPYRMAAADYIRAVLAETFGSAHVELVEGELIETAPSAWNMGARTPVWLLT